MAAMWIFCVCCVCLVVLGIRVGGRRKKREEAELVNRLKDTCETYQLSCPYCDCVSYSRVKWGGEARNLYLYQLRQELHPGGAGEPAGKRPGTGRFLLPWADPERGDPGEGEKGRGHITFQENGVVTWYQNGVGEAADPVGQLYGLETKQGRLAGGPALHGLLPGPDAGIQLLADGQRLCLGARV